MRAVPLCLFSVLGARQPAFQIGLTTRPVGAILGEHQAQLLSWQSVKKALWTLQDLLLVGEKDNRKQRK